MQEAGRQESGRPQPPGLSHPSAGDPWARPPVGAGCVVLGSAVFVRSRRVPFLQTEPLKLFQKKKLRCITAFSLIGDSSPMKGTRLEMEHIDISLKPIVNEEVNSF